MLDKLNVSRTDFHLSAVRIHSAQTSIRQKHAMDKEHQLVVASRHIIPLLYETFIGIYIIAHDWEKLRFSWANKGFEGVWQLIADRYQRSRRPKEI